MSTWVGLDISKDTIDVGFIKDGVINHFKIKNNLSGFKELRYKIPENSKYIMEATGIYFLKCASFLVANHEYVSVENPLKIKRFAEMGLRRSKTDKKDALLISRYGSHLMPKPWRQPSKEQLKSQEIQSVIHNYSSSIIRLKNEYHAFSKSGNENDFLLKSIKKMIEEIKKSKQLLEAELHHLIEASFPEEVKLITSIPGIGINTACLIIGRVGDASSFERSGQLASYFGITPVESYSGTSLNSKGVMSRMGSPRIRAKLYMCGVASLTSNPRIVAMRERMKDKGKHNKKIIVAAMNKLVRQIFGVLKSGKPFDPNYC